MIWLIWSEEYLLSIRDERVLEALTLTDRRDFLTDDTIQVGTVDWKSVDNILNMLYKSPRLASTLDKFKEFEFQIWMFPFAIVDNTGHLDNGQRVVYATERFDEYLSKYTKLKKELNLNPFQKLKLRKLFSYMDNIIESYDRFVVTMSSLVYVNSPLPISDAQTCSQPSTVAFMADVLKLENGMNVLEIGTGCGYHAAVISHLLGKEGYLVSMEVVPELVDMGHNNLEKHLGSFEDASEVLVVEEDGKLGYPEKAPYDRIYLTAGIKDKFDFSVLRSQLKPDGLLLYPQQLGPMTMENKDGNIIKEYGNFSFVPLV